LTPRQQAVYKAICAFRRKTGRSPTLREIAVAVNRKSLSGIHARIKSLLDDGALLRGTGGTLIPVPLKLQSWLFCRQGHQAIWFWAGKCPLCLWAESAPKQS